MASYTPNLNLLMKDPVADGADTFNIQTMLNENWEKIDRQVLRAMAAAAAYDAGTTYQQGDFCTQGGLLYRANQAIAQPEAWTAGHWTEISITDVIRGLTAADVGAIPTSEKGTANGVATLGDDAQVPYGQTPHLISYRTLYVDPISGNDANPGTQSAPYKTIQAAVDATPKDLNRNRTTIKLKEGFYDEEVSIYGFYGGSLDYGLLIEGDSDLPENVRVKKFEIRSNTNFIELLNLSIVGIENPSLTMSNSKVILCNIIVKPGGEMTSGYASSAVQIGANAFVRIQNVTIDTADKTWDGMSVEAGALITGYGLTIKNCNIGLRIGNDASRTCGIAALYQQPIYEGNTVNCRISGMGSIAGGLTT